MKRDLRALAAAGALLTVLAAADAAFAPKIRFAPDSPLEGGGFEPSVPRMRPSPPWPLNLLQP